MKQNLIIAIAGIEAGAKKFLRLTVAIVFIWIGGLKFFTYEADGIVPFVANSPFMSFFYNHPAEYKKYMNKEGELIGKNHEWHLRNNTYGFSIGLGIFLIIAGSSVLLYKIAPMWSIIGTALICIIMLGTLSFLITTPESWVPALGDKEFGFPYLSGRGRLVIKDLAILGASLFLLSDTAKLYLQKK